MILFGLLWPIPFALISEHLVFMPLVRYVYAPVDNGMTPNDFQVWLFEHVLGPISGIPRLGDGYWWPLLGVMATGVILCVLSRYDSGTKEAVDKTNTAIGKRVRNISPYKIFGYGLLGIAGFYLVVLFFVAIYYLFFTELFEVTVPVLFGLLLLGFFIFIGYSYYYDYKDKQDKRNKSK